MSSKQIVLFGVVIAMLSAFGGYGLQHYLNKKEPSVTTNNTSSKPGSPEDLIGSQITEFKLQDVEGELRSSSEWNGKVMAINFWATWCPPCREEIPYFVELQDQYANDGLQFIGVALQHADEVREFLEEFGFNYPSLVGGDDVRSLAEQLGNDIGALPYTVIVDRTGKIAFTRRGPISKDEAESVIQTLL